MEKYCINHSDKLVYCKGLCRSCYEKQLINNNPEYKERQQTNSRKWGEKNKEWKSSYDKTYRIRKPVDKDKKYLKAIEKKLKITPEQYTSLLESCGNKCMLCNRPPHEGKKLHLDHCHETGKVRGLLCTRCNWYLHTVEKDPDILNRIKTYISGE